MKCRFCGGETESHTGQGSFENKIEYSFCRKCLVAMKPQTQDYNGFSRETLKKVGHLDLGNIARQYIHIAAKIVQLKVGSLLDYGCATGGVLRLMKVLGYDVFGYDICPVSVEVCIENDLPATTNINELTAKYDVIWCSETIEHIEFPNRFMNFARDHITKGGVVYIQTQQPALNGEKYDFAYQNAHTNLLTPECLEREMGQRGFKVIEGGQNDLGCYWRFFEG